MLLLVLGIADLIVFGVVVWLLLPRGGQRHRFVETELEPYICVALTALFALGLTMTLSGAINLAAP